ncbi:MAG: ion channel [Pseudomonadota bacterium]
MSLALQIALGTLICAVCAIVQLLVVAKGLQRIDASASEKRMGQTVTAVLIILMAHLAQIGLWTLAFLPSGSFATLEEALYFAVASYTTLGFGDVLIAEEVRILGALPAVAGLISFGISTAFLFGLLSEFLRDR